MDSSNNIPLDIISDILLRLPIKSIGRFRCVSKSWLCLISESRFVKKHLHQSISNNSDDDDDTTRIVIQNEDEAMLINPSQLEPIDFHGEVCETFKVVHSGLEGRFTKSIVGSCNGLVVLVLDNNNTSIFVCNLCTRDFRELPKLDMTNKYVFGGIGYDSSSDDYKVLISTNVFSPKNNYWRKTLTHVACDIRQKEGVCYNGSIHWIVRRETRLVTLSFDLETEQYLQSPRLQLPPIPDNFDYDRLFLMGENLSLFLYGMYQFKHEVWAMNKKGVELAWTKSFVVHSSCDYYLRPICVLKSDELLIHSDDMKLILYNQKDGTSRYFFIFNDDHVSDGVLQVVGYNESLVSPYQGRSRLGGQ